MTKVPTHMLLRKGVLYYNRRVPNDLRSDPRFGGKAMFTVSLGVRTVAEARRRTQELGFDEMFQPRHSPAQSREAGTVITTPLLRQLANENFRRGLESLRNSPSDQSDVERTDVYDELAAQNVGALNNPELSAATRDALRREYTPVLQAQAEGTAIRLGIDPTTTNIEQMVGALFESEVALERARVDLADGHAFTSWSAGGVSGDKSDTAPTEREAHWSFKKLAQAAMRQHPKGESWQHKVGTVSALFNEYVGGVPIHKIDRRKIREFMNEIQFMPKSMTQRFPGMTLKEAVAANDARDKPYKVISPNTARDGYFSILRWSFAHAVELEAVVVNPCTGIRIKGATKSTGKRTRNPFTVAELNAFFQLPVFTGCLSEDRPNTPGNFTFDDHRKWAPLILLFSGARPSEIAQLAVSDIKGDGPQPFISILTEYDPDDPDDERDFVVSHKTENARRDIPMHPKLIELGLLRYVQRRKEAGDIRLFPNWTLPSDGRKLYSSASWIRNLNDKMIPKITTRRPKPTLYSFRHIWKTQMAICQVPAQYQNQILGHAQQGMDEHYLGRMDIEHTYKAISRVSFDNLDIDHLISY